MLWLGREFINETHNPPAAGENMGRASEGLHRGGDAPVTTQRTGKCEMRLRSGPDIQPTFSCSKQWWMLIIAQTAIWQYIKYSYSHSHSIGFFISTKKRWNSKTPTITFTSRSGESLPPSLLPLKAKQESVKSFGFLRVLLRKYKSYFTWSNHKAMHTVNTTVGNFSHSQSLPVGTAKSEYIQY